MKNKVSKWILIAGLPFVVLFIAHLTYQMISGGVYAAVMEAPRATTGNVYQNQNPNVTENEVSINSDNRQSGKKNYATKKISVEKGYVSKDSGELTPTIEQKYEKIANVYSQTKAFDKDLTNLQALISNYNAVVQYQNLSGVEGNRVIDLSIGVDPEKFDAFLTEIKKISELQNFNVSLIDKTSEFKDLNVERESLEKMRDALKALKNRSGKVNEYIDLEARILEVERQIQDTGVKLGDFSQENEFSTVRLTLSEVRSVTIRIDIIGVGVISMKWTVGAYLFLLALGIGLTLTVLILNKLIEKLQWLPKYIGEQMNKK